MVFALKVALCIICAMHGTDRIVHKSTRKQYIKSQSRSFVRDPGVDHGLHCLNHEEYLDSVYSGTIQYEGER